MGLPDALKKLFAGGTVRPEADVLFIYARCKRCGEIVRSRIDKRNELSPGDGGFTWRKELIGSGQFRCFQRIEVVLQFNSKHEVTEQRIYNGEFVTEDDYEAYLASLQGEEESGEQADAADEIPPA